MPAPHRQDGSSAWRRAARRSPRASTISGMVEPRFGAWPIARIDHDAIQRWVNDMSAAGLGPRTVRWTHTVLKMTLDHAVDAGHLIAKNPAARTKFPPMRPTTHIYLTAAEAAALARAPGDQGDVVMILAYTGLRFGELTGLNVEDVELDARRIRVRRSITQVGGKLVEGNPKSVAGRRSIPIPERLVPLLKARLNGRPRGAPAVASPRGSRLSLENWKRAVGWRKATEQVGRQELRGPRLCGIPTRRCHDEPALIFGCCRRRRARVDHRDRPHLRRPI